MNINLLLPLTHSLLLQEFFTHQSFSFLCLVNEVAHFKWKIARYSPKKCEHVLAQASKIFDMIFFFFFLLRGRKSSLFPTRIYDQSLFNTWSSCECILGLSQYLCDTWTNSVFKFKERRIHKCVQFPYELHREEKWHLHFISYLYYCRKDKYTVLSVILCWRN